MMSRGIITLSSIAALAALGAYYYSPTLLGPGPGPNGTGGSSSSGADSDVPVSQSPTRLGRPTALASSAEEFVAQEFDYVVVGGGTAGLVVAARLSEDERVRVGVLEAGGYVPPGEEPRIDLIVNYGRVFGDPKFDWNLKSVPQEGLDGRVVQETV
jgi:GMC oxidoreductase